jgi:proton-dependent oligopeptide transporter, POT family
MASINAALAEEREGTLFGHPRGLSFLFATEMWERFSYYGMRSILVLYMVKYLLHPEHAQDVIGFSAIRGLSEGIYGPQEMQPLSSLIYGSYTALVYLTPIFGGLLADRLLGQRRTVILGALLMAAGHFMMAVEALFLFALLLLILGNGCFKPNISTQVGGLYRPGDPRRDRAYSIFYVGINVGAFFSPLVCGTLGERAGWHYGFAAAGIGMLLATGVYLYAQRLLPSDEVARTTAARPENGGTRSLRAILALLILFLPTTLFWATYEQGGNTITLWADQFTDRSIGSFFEIPATWFQALNPFMIFAFTPFVVAFWAQQAARGREPSSVTKMGIGLFGVALSYLVLVAAAHGIAGGGKASWLWIVAFNVVITLGELYLSPVGLSLVSKIAPPALVSMLMGVWLATSFLGNYLAGWLGHFWSAMDKTGFFLLMAAIAAGAGLFILALSRPLRSSLDG